MQNSPAPNRSDAKWAIGILLLIGLVHVNSLQNGFHNDDGHSIQRNPHIRSLSPWDFVSNPTTFSENPAYAMYRPVTVLTMALNFAAGGDEPGGYVGINVFIHALVSTVAFLLFRSMGIPLSCSLLGSLTAGLHPLNTEVVNYVNTRSESLAALFYLLACWSYLYYSSCSSRNWLWLSCICFGTALLSKEIAITLPFTLLLFRWLGIIGERQAALRTALLSLLPFWIILISYFIVRQLVMPQAESGYAHSLEAQFATQWKAIIHYLLVVGIPVALNVTPQFTPSPNFWSVAPVLAMFASTGVIGGALLLRRSTPVITSTVLWFVIALGPVLIVPLHVLVNNHRPYLSTVAWGMLLAWLLQHARLQRLWIAVLIAFAALSVQRNLEWRDEITLWTKAVERAPMMSAAHYNLGVAHHQEEQLELARVSYEKAVALEPRYSRALNNLGAVYRLAGELHRARTVLLRAVEVDPESMEALNNLGLVEASLGNLEGAVELYRTALAIDVTRAEIWLNLGLAQRDLGRKQDAFASLNRALQLDPEIKRKVSTAEPSRP